MYVAEADGSHVRLLVDGGVTPSWSPDGVQIAYAAPGGLFLVDVDRALGGDVAATRSLTEATQPQEYPDWSPDGHRLLFAGYVPDGPIGGSYDIWVVDADGTNLRNLTPDPSLEYGASWSADGTRIVFGSLRESDTDRGEDLFVVDVDGSGLSQLTTTGGNGAPAWSPDGQWIAFVSNEAGNPDIYIMRPDGSQPRQLTTDPAGDYSPAWVGEC